MLATGTLRLPPLLALLAVQVLFGLHPVVSKLAFPAFGPGGVSAARAVGAAVVFWLAARVAGEPPVPRELWPRLALASLLGVVSNQLLFMYGLALTSATHATLIIATIPVATLAIAILSRREALRWHRAVGIGMALVGAGLVLAERGTTGPGGLLGDLMVASNAVAYAAYLVLSRDLLQRVSPLSLAAWLFGLGAPVVLAFTGLPPVAGHPPEAWWALGFVVLGPTIGTYFLNLFALRDVPASVVAVFICLQPLVTGAFAARWLGEAITPTTAGAAILTLAGVVLATRPARA